MNNGTRDAVDSQAFLQRLLAVALVVLAGLLLWKLADVVLLTAVAVLIGIGLGGLTDALQRSARFPRWACLSVVVTGTFAFMGLVFWIFGAQIADQYADLVVRLPVAVAKVAEAAGRTPVGRYALEQVRLAGASTAPAAVASLLTQVSVSISKGFSYALMAVACGVFFAIEPERYLSGVRALCPSGLKQRFSLFIDRVNLDMRRWLVSRLLVMLVVGVMSALGLWALGIEAAFALGITGGILTFIPLIGALMAAIPAIVMAFAKDPIYALWATLLFWGVHFIEGTFITPYVQDKAVDLPAAVTILSTFAFTLLCGGWGVLFATPLTLVLIIAVQTFYLETREVRPGAAASAS